MSGLAHPKNHHARHLVGGGDAIPGLLTSSSIGRYNVKDYGALGDGATDDQAAFDAAIAAVVAAGGGIVYCPAATYRVSGSVLIEHSGVALRGDGQDVTIIRRTGASTAPVVWMRTPDLQSLLVRDARLSEVTIDGNGVTDYGLRMTSIDFATVKGCKITGATQWQLYMDCWDTRPGGGDPRDTQHCSLTDLYLRCAGGQGGAKLTGNSVLDANTSLNYFANILPWIVDGDGFVFDNSDGNTLVHLRPYRAGTGRGLVFNGHATSAVGMARNNFCFDVQAADTGIYALAGAHPSYDNVVVNSRGNGGTDPTISAGATLVFLNELGGNLNVSAIKYPAAQVASTDANTLDDYEEGTWVPVLGFTGGNGNLAVAYTVQVAYYQKIGNRVYWQLHVLTSSFTQTTAAGNLMLTGLPYAAQNVVGDLPGACAFGGYTKANFTAIAAVVAQNQSRVTFLAGGSGQALVALAVGDVPTGGTVHIRASGSYVAAA